MLFNPFPTREFRFILDPYCLEYCGDYRTVFALINDLQSIDPPLKISIIVPTYLGNFPVPVWLATQTSWFSPLPTSPSDASLEWKPFVPQDMQEKFQTETHESRHAMALLMLADSLVADGIFTQMSILLDGRYKLHGYQGVRIIPLEEFADTVEIIAHGNHIFWSASYPERNLFLDIYYPIAHWENARYYSWFNKIQENVNNTELKESLHNALLNRYSYILYSRDMVRYWEIQKDHSSRRSSIKRYSASIGYHMNTFYFLLWGMLDELTVIAKYVMNLKVKERDCGIRSNKFWKALASQQPGLKKFAKYNEIATWINIMADIRNHAGHKVIKIPTEVLADTEESRKSDEEIREIIRRENDFLYQTLDPSEIAKIEPIMIQQWRIDRMQRIAPSQVFIETKEGGYMWDPVVSVDHALERLTAVIDAFLVGLFGKDSEEASHT